MYSKVFQIDFLNYIQIYYSSHTCDEESITQFRWEVMAKPQELGTLENDDEFSWIAVAFSNDKKLGDDLTFPCTNAPDEKLVMILTMFNLQHLPKHIEIIYKIQVHQKVK